MYIALQSTTAAGAHPFVDLGGGGGGVGGPVFTTIAQTVFLAVVCCEPGPRDIFRHVSILQFLSFYILLLE